MLWNEASYLVRCRSHVVRQCDLSCQLWLSSCLEYKCCELPCGRTLSCREEEYVMRLSVLNRTVKENHTILQSWQMWRWSINFQIWWLGLVLGFVGSLPYKLPCGRTSSCREKEFVTRLSVLNRTVNTWHVAISFAIFKNF